MTDIFPPREPSRAIWRGTPLLLDCKSQESYNVENVKRSEVFVSKGVASSYKLLNSSYVKYLLLAFLLFPAAFHAKPAFAEVVTASYYTLESVLKEGNSGITASGEKYRESRQTCAHPTYPFGTILKITNPKNGKWIYAKVNDRGPAAWTRHGIDLTPKGFELLGLKGLGKVNVRRVKK